MKNSIRKVQPGAQDLAIWKKGSNEPIWIYHLFNLFLTDGQPLINKFLLDLSDQDYALLHKLGMPKTINTAKTLKKHCIKYQFDARKNAFVNQSYERARDKLNKEIVDKGDGMAVLANNLLLLANKSIATKIEANEVMTVSESIAVLKLGTEIRLLIETLDQRKRFKSLNVKALPDNKLKQLLDLIDTNNNLESVIDTNFAEEVDDE